MYYSSRQIIERTKQIDAKTETPSGYWLCFIRKNLMDQQPNQFNDVAYLMYKDKIIIETTCTTVPGLPALKGGYKRYNKKGAAVLKSNIWMLDAFAYGLHNGKMKALRQVEKLWSYRDGDGDNKAEQLGTPYFGMWHTNIHAATYNPLSDIVRRLIGEWSYGCIVLNNRQEYNQIINFCKLQPRVSAIILDEFSI